MDEGQRVETRKEDGDLGGTMRLGAYTAMLTPGSRVAEIYGANEISERHRHRYEVNVGYTRQLAEHGFQVSGWSPDGKLPEIMEFPDHPWFIGVQFHPELKSRPLRPASAVREFCGGGGEAGAVGHQPASQSACMNSSGLHRPIKHRSNEFGNRYRDVRRTDSHFSRVIEPEGLSRIRDSERKDSLPSGRGNRSGFRVRFRSCVRLLQQADGIGLRLAGQIRTVRRYG
jgi:hypothetical protein